MKTDDFTKHIPKPLKTNPMGNKRRLPRARRRWRVEIINENTLSRLWSLRLSGIKVWLAGTAVVAAIASLIAMIFMFTPLGKLLPGQLRGDLRAGYLEAALRIDSLQRVTREQEAFTRNIMAILSDSLSAGPATASNAATASTTDSLISASEAERRFVRQFEEEERFNLSVLSPIAAEGMIFEAPTASEDGTGPVAAVYRGTVVGLTETAGTTTLTIQHPNDFISVYSRLANAYVAKGDKVLAGQRIGAATSGAPVLFELWHGGSSLDPANYLPH
ncbi:MAG: M23 family metallopeptidase [Muribaculaceae bacterium]|nr:M23 family metallopeptidase [Muribaculaceae bacterium]